MSISDEKKTQRVEFERRLTALDFFSLIDKSSRLSQQFLQFTQANSGIFKNRFVVSFYPFETEPQINIENEARTEPFQVAYVRIVDWRSGLMEAREARRDTPDLWEEFELKNGNKIFQPRTTQPLCDGNKIAAILVPGLAFTKEGARLGRGVGFYDRYLAKHPEALRIGVAFEEQVTQKIPTEAWDERLDILLTDQALYSTKSYGEWKIHGKVINRQSL